jgi:hypothetical protein
MPVSEVGKKKLEKFNTSHIQSRARGGAAFAAAAVASRVTTSTSKVRYL